VAKFKVSSSAQNMKTIVASLSESWLTGLADSVQQQTALEISKKIAK
jgi:hypothetical protein